MSSDWIGGCAYLAAYAAWTWFFRAWVDPRLQARVGRRLRTPVAWVRATTFPMELWVWGLREPGDERLDTRLALASAAIALVGVFLPIGLLCAFELWVGGLPEAVTAALYLTTPLLFFLFIVSHLRWREPAGRGPVVLGLDPKHDS